jgi:hypothetical protein
MAFCKRNVELPLLLSGHVSLDSNASSTNMTTAEVDLFPTLFRVAQQTPRMGPNAVFAGLLASKCAAHLQQKQTNGNKRLL